MSRFSYSAVAPISYLITRGKLTDSNFRSESKQTLLIIDEAVKAGVSLIQIREKALSASLLFTLASKAKEITGRRATRLLVNERFDIEPRMG